MDLTHFADLDLNPYSHVSYYTNLSEKHCQVTEMVEELGHQIITVEGNENTPKSRALLMSTSDGEGIAESETDKVVQNSGSNTKANQHQIVRGEHNHMKLIRRTTIDPKFLIQRTNLTMGETSYRMTANQNISLANSLESNPRQRSEARLVTQSLSNSLSDIDIHNYNRLIWMRNNSVEALNLWKLGKDIGFTHVGRKIT